VPQIRLAEIWQIWHSMLLAPVDLDRMRDKKTAKAVRSPEIESSKRGPEMESSDCVRIFKFSNCRIIKFTTFNLS